MYLDRHLHDWRTRVVLGILPVLLLGASAGCGYRGGHPSEELGEFAIDSSGSASIRMQLRGRFEGLALLWVGGPGETGRAALESAGFEYRLIPDDPAAPSLDCRVEEDEVVVEHGRAQYGIREGTPGLFLGCGQERFFEFANSAYELSFQKPVSYTIEFFWTVEERPVGATAEVTVVLFQFRELSWYEELYWEDKAL